jgi:formimidoylglutamate deiminase
MVERILHCARALLGDGWHNDVRLHIDGQGEIDSITSGPPQETDTRLTGAVLPGMPNLHSHGFQHLIAGLTGAAEQTADSFWGWRAAMYRLAGGLTPRQFQDCLAWVYLRMLRAGYTSCAEFHYLHHEADGRSFEDSAEMSARVLAAARSAGMPVTLLPVLYCRSGFDREDVELQQRRYRHSVESYLKLLEACGRLVAASPGCRLGVAPHSLRAVGREGLAEVLAEVPGHWPIHIHVAEQPGEVEQCLESYGARPVDWLLEDFPVAANWCLVHATHMTEEERRRAAGSSAVAGLCPTTEADLGDGCFATASWVSLGGRLGIGSDSNVRISVTEELRQLEYVERVRTGSRNVLRTGGESCGRFLYSRAAAGGAQALGQAVGQLAPGFRADLVELDTGNVLLEGRSGDTLLESWVFAGGEEMLHSVWVAGKPVIEEGRHPAQERLEAGFRAAMTAMLSA